jgi:hypothetical protein
VLKRILSLTAFLVVASGFASADSIQFIGVPTGVNDGYYYDLPYEISIDGVDQLVTCYDVFDDVNFGDNWQASLSTLSQASAIGYFARDPNAMAGYEEIAWLDAQAYTNTTQQIGLQYAIWNVFGTYATSAASLAYTAQANAAAASGYQGFSFDNVRFVEQMGGVVGQNGTEQAFVYWETPAAQPGNVVRATPEAATILLMFLGLVSVAAAHRLFHRRFEQSVVRAGVRRGQHLP